MKQIGIDTSKAFNIITSKIDEWIEQMVAILPNFVVAIIVLTIFFFLAKMAMKLTNNLIGRISEKQILNMLLAKTVYLFVLILGLIIALNILNLEKTVTSLLAGAGVIGLAIGFAFQDISANFISGIILALRKPINVGDIVESNDYMGFVEQIDLRSTVVRTFQGLHIIIPNKDVLQKPITNYTKTHERRIDLEVGVSYGDDLEKVAEIAKNAISGADYLLKGKDVALHYTEFGSSSINFVLMFWVSYPGQQDFLRARSNAIIAIKKAFDENDITIPFPIRTLDFGIKGGESLSEMTLQTQQPNND